MKRSSRTDLELRVGAGPRKLLPSVSESVRRHPYIFGLLVPQGWVPVLDERSDGLDGPPRCEPDLFPLLAQLASPDPSSSILGLPDCSYLGCEYVRGESEAREGDELRRGGEVTGAEGGENACGMRDRMSSLRIGRSLGIGSGCF